MSSAITCLAVLKFSASNHLFLSKRKTPENPFGNNIIIRRFVIALIIPITSLGLSIAPNDIIPICFSLLT